MWPFIKRSRLFSTFLLSHFFEYHKLPHITNCPSSRDPCPSSHPLPPLGAARGLRQGEARHRHLRLWRPGVGDEGGLSLPVRHQRGVPCGGGSRDSAGQVSVANGTVLPSSDGSCFKLLPVLASDLIIVFMAVSCSVFSPVHFHQHNCFMTQCLQNCRILC